METASDMVHGRGGWELSAFEWQGSEAVFTYRKVGYSDIVKVVRRRAGGPLKPPVEEEEFQ